MDLRSDARLAGQVTRFHTWVKLREQSTGEHSWQVARIIMAIAPAYCDQLLPYAILHDMGEIAVGDVPYPVKADNEDLGRMFSELEDAALRTICDKWMLNSEFLKIDKDLKTIFKLAEFIEMWEWGVEERLRGNQFASKVESRCLRAIDRYLVDVELIDRNVKHRAVQYVDCRIRECRV